MNTAPHIVAAATVVEAWTECAQVLLRDGDRHNPVVNVTNPAILDMEQLERFDPRGIDPLVMSLFDVANTIFPSKGPKWGLSVDKFSEYYVPAYARLTRRKPGSWGVYFQRLVSFGPDKINQLARVVNGINGWGRNHHAAFVIHLSSSDLDKPRPLGAPCWQYAQFMRANEAELSLTVVFRSHDYFQKALGNFVGLSRLLSFVCEQTGFSVGTLSCLSTYAFLAPPRKRTVQLLTKGSDDSIRKG